MSVHLFGIRHHGPGSARALAAALPELRPDIVLIEGPPEADKVVELAAAEEMVPPVALLAYAADDSTRAAFWPFAVFSPEWQAIRHALAAGVPVRFCDLPAAYQFGSSERGERRGLSADPLATLAAAGGYDDPERWWDDVIEHRRDGAEPFTVIAEAMTELRRGEEATGREAQREAYMRTTLRKAIKEGFERIAVVCGAWHVPALQAPLPPATHDQRILKGLPKRKVVCTWVPWTHGRLASASGYGAGVTSPGWYHHLFTAPDQIPLAHEGRPGTTGRRPPRVECSRDRGGPVGRYAGRVAGTAARRAERGHRGNASGDVQRQRRPARPGDSRGGRRGVAGRSTG
jgi:hypothetical protein